MVFGIVSESASPLLGSPIIIIIIIHHPIPNQGHDFTFLGQNSLSHQTDVKISLMGLRVLPCHQMITQLRAKGPQGGHEATKTQLLNTPAA